MIRLKDPKPNTFFTSHNGFLALFQKKAKEEYWKGYWYAEDANYYSHERIVKEEEYNLFMTQSIRRDLPVLEAGCGVGRFVQAFKREGYQAIGIDNDLKVVKLANQEKSDLDIRQGDVTKLDFEDRAFGCYFSLGVVEHFESGPLEALKEAKRVLNPNGIAFISVPYLNSLRKKYKGKIQESNNLKKNTTFHQYYYSLEDLKGYLDKAGFELMSYQPIAVEAFLIREHPLFSIFWKSLLCRERIKIILRAVFLKCPFFLRKRYGHMVMVICRIKQDTKHEE